VEGWVRQPGDIVAIGLKVEKAQDIVAFEVETPEATLPRFNPVVRLLERGGREIATDVYTKLNNNGLYMMKMIRPKTTLSIAPGEYTVQIRDITTSGAGPDFHYRVLVRTQIPHVGNVGIAQDHVNVHAGASRPLSVAIDREEGFGGYVAVNVEGLPAGVTALPALENPEDKPPLPNGGKLERYTPREQRTTVMLVAAPDAPPSDLPVSIRVIVRVIGEGRLGQPVAIKEIPVMVLPGKTS
jgi:hypothetical protein